MNKKKGEYEMKLGHTDKAGMRDLSTSWNTQARTEIEAKHIMMIAVRKSI